MINLDNFVNINIDYISNVVASSSKDTMLLLDDDSTTTAFAEADTIISSMPDEDDLAKTDRLYKYFKTFFDNGGRKIHYLKCSQALDSDNIDSVTVGGTGSTITVQSYLENTTDEIIVVKTFLDTEGMVAIASLEKDLLVGVHERIFVTGASQDYVSANHTALDGLNNLVVKYGTTGIEMTVGAYFTSFNIDDGAIEDYCYTSEDLSALDESTNVISANSTFKTIKSFDRYNVDVDICDDIKNYGGNNANKLDLTNYFVKILLTQSLTEKLTKVLATKIRYNNNGLGLINSAIVDEMNRYKKFGYLSLNKSWTYDDLYDGDTLIISKGTSLPLGYYVYIMPLSSLSNDDKKAHKLPTIHLIIADTYSVREIVVNGKVL